MCVCILYHSPEGFSMLVYYVQMSFSDYLSEYPLTSYVMLNVRY